MTDIPLFPLTDDFAAIVPRISGSISALSSAIIIIIIVRSTSKLSIIYHRIMFMMSCADILSSVAMGLTTLPMPREGMLRPGIIDAQWSGKRVGNVNTCTAQGFFFNFGLVCMFAYNCSLCTYYACAVAFQIQERKIKKYIEPILHIIPVVGALSVALVPVFFDAYNPTGFEAWCTVYRGDEANLDRAIRGTIITIVSYSIGFVFVLILVMFSLIIWRVVKIQRTFNSVPFDTVREDENEIQQRDSEDEDVSYKSSSRGYNEDDERTSSDEQDMMRRVNGSQRNMRVVIIQAFAYVLTFLLSLLCPLIRSLLKPKNTDLLWLTRLQAILMPLQGFFNAVIFISHKFYNYYHAHQNLSTCHILSIILFQGYQEPVMLSRISLVRYDQNQARLDIRLENEKNIELMSFDVSGSGLDVQINGESDNDLKGFSSDFKESRNGDSSGFSNDSQELRDGAQSSKLSYNSGSTL